MDCNEVHLLDFFFFLVWSGTRVMADETIGTAGEEKISSTLQVSFA